MEKNKPAATPFETLFTPPIKVWPEWNCPKPSESDGMHLYFQSGGFTVPISFFDARGLTGLRNALLTPSEGEVWIKVCEPECDDYNVSVETKRTGDNVEISLGDGTFDLIFELSIGDCNRLANTLDQWASLFIKRHSIK